MAGSSFTRQLRLPSRITPTANAIDGAMPSHEITLVDTPGYQTEHKSALNREMNRTVGQVASEVDVIVLVIDAAGWDERDLPVLALLPQGVPVILALNKVDTLANRDDVLPIIAKVAERLKSLRQSQPHGQQPESTQYEGGYRADWLEAKAILARNRNGWSPSGNDYGS